jgi:opacity protein-like surface antigen
MKKLILLSLMMLLGLPLAAYAAPVGGPPVKGLSIGLGQDFVFDRDLKPSAVVVPQAIMINDGEIDGVRLGCDIKNMYRTMLQVGYGFFDFLEVYVKLGGQGYTVKTDVVDQFGSPEGDVKVHGRFGFAYGGGLKAAYEFKDGPVRGLLIGADAQYLRARNRFRANSTDLLGVEESSTGKVTFQEWQFGPFVGYRIMNFLPYVGVKYSDVRIKFSSAEDAETTKFKAEDHVGMFAGLTYSILPQLMLNLEGRFIDETALNFNVIFRFK